MYNAVLIYFLVLLIVAIAAIAIIIKLNLFLSIKTISAISLIILLPIIIAYIYFSYFIKAPETTVPNVIGQSRDDAIQKIKESGLKFSVEQDRPEYAVVKNQRPAANRTVKLGRVVTIILGTGEAAFDQKPPATQEILIEIPISSNEAEPEDQNEGEKVQ